MYTQEDILAIMKEREVLLEGHFLLSSGRHGDRYLQCARLLQYPEVAAPLCAQLAAMFADEGITVVAGPATGAIILAYEVARALGVKAVFSERDNGVMTFRRGFVVKPEDRVLVVEDVITTGGSSKEVIAALNKIGSAIVGVAAIADRSGGRTDFGVPFKALVSLDIKSFLPEECPLCRQGVPVVKPGSRVTA
ncbi:MAG: orotate phosphoribosyltransferase [Clostridiales bacterium]|nr:orotate phosphoribosyltransferase [Clostridiales bacterium]MDR2711698.1 orotate phosphoribosyltransferase [Clostridiales bacterium]